MDLHSLSGEQPSKPSFCQEASWVVRLERIATASILSGSGGPRWSLTVSPTVFTMARWPRHVWTTIFTYGAIFVLFPLLSLLAYGWVRGWWF